MAVLVLPHQKMTPHTLPLQKRFKNTQKPKAVYDFQSTGVCDSLEVIPLPVSVLVDLTDHYERVSVACGKV
jgi:hypothetical protein